MRSALLLWTVVLLFSVGPACSDSKSNDDKNGRGDTVGDIGKDSVDDLAVGDQFHADLADSVDAAPQDLSSQELPSPDLGDQADQAPPVPPLKAGAAAIDITPTVKGVPLAGFGGGDRRTYDVIKAGLGLAGCIDPDPSDAIVMFNENKGTHDPVRAKVLVLDDGKKRVLIVGLDLVGISQEFHADISAAVVQYGIPKQNVMITATHNHSGPGTLSTRKFWQLAAMDCFNQKVYDEVKGQIIKAISTAVNSMEVAELGIQSGEIKDVQKNRRDNPGVFDPTLTVIHVRRAADKKTLATLVNLPVHPTTLGGSNMLFSADFVGYMEKHLETELGGTAIFLNGAEGDVGPKKSKGGFEGSEELGLKIAARVLELIPSEYKPGVVLKAALIFHDFGKPFLRQGCGYQGEIDMCLFFPSIDVSMDLPPEWFPDEVPVGVIMIDKTLIVGLPGEPTTRVGYMVRDALTKEGYTDVILFGLANEHAGYVTTKEEYNIGGYEAIATMFGENTAQKLVDAVIKTVKSLP